MPSLDRSESGISGDFEHLGGNEESVSYSVPESQFKTANPREAQHPNKNKYKVETSAPIARGVRRPATKAPAQRSPSGYSF